MRNRIFREAITWVLIAISVLYLAPGIPAMANFIGTRLQQDLQEVTYEK